MTLLWHNNTCTWPELSGKQRTQGHPANPSQPQLLLQKLPNNEAYHERPPVTEDAPDSVSQACGLPVSLSQWHCMYAAWMMLNMFCYNAGGICMNLGNKTCDSLHHSLLSTVYRRLLRQITPCSGAGVGIIFSYLFLFYSRSTNEVIKLKTICCARNGHSHHPSSETPPLLHRITGSLRFGKDLWDWVQLQT